MKPHQRRLLCVAFAATIAITSAASDAQTPGGVPAAPPKYSPDVPAKITIPDTVETRIGTLRLKDGAPDPATVQLAYDQIDFNRGINAFLTGMSATSVYAICRGLEEAGVKPNQGIGITEQLLDARSLFLTANTTTIYVLMCVNLKDEPVVVRVPPRVLGPVDDADFRWVVDVGLTGPDKGAGGDYLFVPPGYKGTVPAKGYNVAKPRTNRLLVFYRVFVEKGDFAAAAAGVKAKGLLLGASQGWMGEECGARILANQLIFLAHDELFQGHLAQVQPENQPCRLCPGEAAALKSPPDKIRRSQMIVPGFCYLKNGVISDSLIPVG